VCGLASTDKNCVLFWLHNCSEFGIEEDADPLARCEVGSCDRKPTSLQCSEMEGRQLNSQNEVPASLPSASSGSCYFP